MPDQFQILPTPNPEEFSFRVRTDDVLIFPSQMPAIGTPFKSVSVVAVKSRVSQQNLGDYQYTNFDTADGASWWYFAKPKTDAERNTPFRKFWKFDSADWESILQALVFVRDTGFPQSTLAAVGGQRALISGPSNYIRTAFIPGGRIGTRFQVKEYTSPTPFKIPRHRTPVPNMVSYDIAGKHGQFPSCLHDTIQIPSLRTTVSSVVGDVAGSPSGVLTGQTFEATNMITWEREVVHDDQQFTNGVWHRIQIVKYPPPLPETITT
jgi:hypothetical protein